MQYCQTFILRNLGTWSLQLLALLFLSNFLAQRKVRREHMCPLTCLARKMKEVFMEQYFNE